MTVWEPGTQYNSGDIVEYEGARYKIIQPHRSQSDWAPPIVPALWGRISGSECQSQEPCNPSDKDRPYGQDVQRPNDSYQQPNQSVEAPHEEQKKWFDLDDDKDKLIAGGLAAGVAALGIGGYAYHQHQKHKNGEEEQPLSQRPPRPDEGRTEGFLHDNKDKLIAGGVAAAIGGYAYHQHQKHKNDEEEQPTPSQGLPQDARERAEGFLHDNKDKLIAGGLAAGAAAIGGYAYHQHQKHKNDEEEQPAPSQGLPQDARERAEGFLHDNKDKLIAGGVAAGAAAIGGYAYHQHQKHKNDEEEQPAPSQGLPQDARERAEGFLHDNKDKLIAGGVAAGAAAIGGYAYHQHQKHKNDEEEKQALSQGPPPDARERIGGFLDGNKEKIAGGVLGAAALGIGGYAYHEHEKHKKERAEEETRTEGYSGRGSCGPPTWVLVDGRENIPESAIVAGRDRDNHPIYIARAYQGDSLQIGKASPAFREGAAIGYAGKVVELRKFEVLVGDDRAIRWVSFSYQLNLEELQAKPVEGGKESNGAPLYVARVQYNGGVHTAKIGEHLPAAHLAFSGTEVLVDDYEVLCYN